MRCMDCLEQHARVAFGDSMCNNLIEDFASMASVVNDDHNRGQLCTIWLWTSETKVVDL